MSATSSSAPKSAQAFAFQLISKKSIDSTDCSTVYNLINESDMMQVVGHGIFDFPNYPETQKVFNVIYFRFQNEFLGLKGLFNGLIRLGAPRGVIIETQADMNRFALKFYTHDEEKAKNHFLKINNFLYQEVRFKSILNKVLENKRNFEASQQLLKNELFTS